MLPFSRSDYWKRTISPCLDFLRHEKRVLGLMTGQRGIGKTEYVKDKISSTRHAYISLTNLGSQQKLRGELFTKIENPPPLIIDDAHILLQWSEKWVFHVLESAESDRNILLVGSEPMSRRLIQLSNWFAKPLLILPTPFISPSLLASQIPHSILEKCGANLSDLRIVYSKMFLSPEDGMKGLLKLTEIQLATVCQEQVSIRPIILQTMLDLLLVQPLNRLDAWQVINNMLPVSSQDIDETISYLLSEEIIWEDDYSSLLYFRRPILQYVWRDFRKTLPNYNRTFDCSQKLSFQFRSSK